MVNFFFAYPDLKCLSYEVKEQTATVSWLALVPLFLASVYSMVQKAWQHSPEMWT